MRSPHSQRLDERLGSESADSLRPRRITSLQKRPSARRRAARRAGRRSPVIPLAAISLVMLGLLGLIPAYSAVSRSSDQLQAQLAEDFSSGQRDLDNGRSLLKKGTNDRDQAAIQQAQADFGSARIHFQAARTHAESSRLLRLAIASGILTAYARPRLQAVNGLSDMGTALADAANGAAGIDLKLIAPVSAEQHGGARLLAVLKDSEPALQGVRQNLLRAQSAANGVPGGVLPANQQALLTKARESIDLGIQGLAELSNLVPVLFEVLGANGPRTYLMEQVNPAELRAGGGFVGSYSLLTADKGQLKLTQSGGIETVDYPRPVKGQPGYVQPPGPLQEFIGDKSWVLGDSNFFPDFETNAYWGEWFSEREIKVKPDGVISIDPQAIADILGVTGPVTVPGYGVTVNAQNFVQRIFELENVDRPIGRKSFFSALAVPLIEKVSALPASRWPQLISALNTAAARRNLQVYFNNDAAQKELVRFGWSGSLVARNSPDFIAEVESNFGGTKANHYIRRQFDVSLTSSGAGLHHKVSVTVNEDLRGEAVPSYYQFYRCYMRLYVPADATNLTTHSLKPDDFPLTALTSGTRLLDGWFQINPRNGIGSYTASFEYDTPGTYDQSGKHAIYWQKQPGTELDRISVNWNVNGKSFQATADLTQDRVLVLAADGVAIAAGRTASAQIPLLSL